MGRKVLLADDSVAIHRVVNLTFTGENVEVIAVSNGDDAIRLAREAKPDLVIADIFMPGLSGYEVCETLHRQSETEEVPVILLVGAFESFDQNKADEVGATAHMTKPIEPQSLLRLVNNLLDKQREPTEAAKTRNTPVIDRHRPFNGSLYRKSPEAPNLQPLDLLDLTDSEREAAKLENNAPDQSTASPKANGNDIAVDLPASDYDTDSSAWQEPAPRDKSTNELEPIETFIAPLESTDGHSKPGDRKDFYNENIDPAPILNQPDPSPVRFFGEGPAKPKLFITGAEEKESAPDAGMVPTPTIKKPRPSDLIGIDTAVLDSVVAGLTGIPGFPAKAENKDSEKSANSVTSASSRIEAPSANAKRPVSNSVTPQLIDALAERVVKRLRETMREEIRAAIEDSLNEFLNQL